MENLLRGLLAMDNAPGVVLVEAMAFSNGGMGGGGGRMHLPVAQYYGESALSSMTAESIWEVSMCSVDGRIVQGGAICGSTDRDNVIGSGGLDRASGSGGTVYGAEGHCKANGSASGLLHHPSAAHAHKNPIGSAGHGAAKRSSLDNSPRCATAV